MLSLVILVHVILLKFWTRFSFSKEFSPSESCPSCPSWPGSIMDWYPDFAKKMLRFSAKPAQVTWDTVSWSYLHAIYIYINSSNLKGSLCTHFALHFLLWVSVLWCEWGNEILCRRLESPPVSRSEFQMFPSSLRPAMSKSKLPVPVWGMCIFGSCVETTHPFLSPRGITT